MTKNNFLYDQFLTLANELGIDPSTATKPLPKRFRPQKILIIAPHPDDECLMAPLALRAKMEWGAKVGVYPYSLGSLKERQEERKKELVKACSVLGFECLDQTANLYDSIEKCEADCVVFPSLLDLHPAHVKCSAEVMDALQRLEQKTGKKVIRVKTEFWGVNPAGSELVEVPFKIAEMVFQALQCHAGEISRNPYHLRLPAFWSDQVRRGSERARSGDPSAPMVWGQCYEIIL